MVVAKQKADEKLTADEWAKKWEELQEQKIAEPYKKTMTQKEYEAMQRRQAIAKGLLDTGKQVLGGIAGRLGSGLGNTVKWAAGPHPVLNEAAKRLSENYDEAVGTPAYGSMIRETLYGNPNGPLVVRPSAAGGVYSQYNPQELATLQGLYASLLGGAPNGGVATPGGAPTGNVLPPGMTIGMGGAPMYGNEKQVVFLFDNRNDTITETLGEFDTVEQAKAEVQKLRGQGLPAFYAAKNYTLESKRLKA